MARTSGGLRVHVPECDWARGLAASRPELVLESELEQMRPRFADRFRVAVTATRFGPGLAGRILPALAAGLPCVASPAACSDLAAPIRASLRTADSAESFAEALVALATDPREWQHASLAVREGVAARYGSETMCGRVRPIRHAIAISRCGLPRFIGRNARA